MNGLTLEPAGGVGFLAGATRRPYCHQEAAPGAASLPSPFRCWPRTREACGLLTKADFERCAAPVAPAILCQPEAAVAAGGTTGPPGARFRACGWCARPGMGARKTEHRHMIGHDRSKFMMRSLLAHGWPRRQQRDRWPSPQEGPSVALAREVAGASAFLSQHGHEA
jgi:hypothetical protein